MYIEASILSTNFGVSFDVLFSSNNKPIGTETHKIKSNKFECSLDVIFVTK